MYWSGNQIIERAELDGTNRLTVLRDWNSMYDVLGLALDIQTNGLYFASFRKSSIYHIALDDRCRTRKVLEVPRSLGRPFLLAVDDLFLYWNTGYHIPGNTYRTDKTRINDQFEIVLKGLKDPRGIAIHKGNSTQDSKYTAYSVSH